MTHQTASIEQKYDERQKLKDKTHTGGEYLGGNRSIDTELKTPHARQKDKVGVCYDTNVGVLTVSKSSCGWISKCVTDVSDVCVYVVVHALYIYISVWVWIDKSQRAKMEKLGPALFAETTPTIAVPHSQL